MKRAHLTLEPTTLPDGASCAASCQHAAACRTSVEGFKGSENVCYHTPSRFAPHRLAGGMMAQSSWETIERALPAVEKTGAAS